MTRKVMTREELDRAWADLDRKWAAIPKVFALTTWILAIAILVTWLVN